MLDSDMRKKTYPIFHKQKPGIIVAPNADANLRTNNIWLMGKNIRNDIMKTFSVRIWVLHTIGMKYIVAPNVAMYINLEMVVFKNPNRVRIWTTKRKYTNNPLPLQGN